MKKITLLPEKKRLRPLVLLLVLAVLAAAVRLSRPRPPVSEDAERVMSQVHCVLQTRNEPQLEKHILELNRIGNEVADKELGQRIRESAALLAMVHMVWKQDEVGAIQIFEQRYKENPGRMIYVEHFDPVLPYVKQTMINVFLKQLDLQGAYAFNFAYPPVVQGRHARYFNAMDMFLSGDMDGAEKKLQELLKKEPDNKMYASLIAYIGRVREKGILKKDSKPDKGPAPVSGKMI